MITCFNGKFGKVEDFSVSPFSDSVQFGRSVFETLRTYGGTRIFEAEVHLDRLFESAEILKLNLHNSVDKLRRQIKYCMEQLVERNQAGGKDLRIKVFLAEEFFWIITRVLDEVSPDFYALGVEIVDAVFERNFPRAKYVNPAYGYFQRVQPKEAFVTIFFSDDGFLREGTIVNVFALLNGTIVTPEKNILLGVTREEVLRVAKKQEFGVEVREISRGELMTADEIFLTCTSKEVIPVRKWGEWENGDFTVAHKLRANFPKNDNFR